MYTRLSYLLLALLLLSGCSQLGQQWSNFSAYHNTFYNARLSFEEGVEAVENPDAPVERGAFLPVFGTTSSASNPEPFEEAIRRSADILRKHPNSRWVDEALLIIGRSYLYLDNYVGAEQKFEELLALESSRHEEAYYWLGRTLIEAERYEEAVGVMEEALAQESPSRSWMGRYYLVSATALLERGAFAEAAPLLERGARAVPERKLEARAWFLAGQVNETLEQYAEAAEAYDRAAARSFDQDLVYEATVSRVRSLTSIPERREEALVQVSRMARQQAFARRSSEITYLEGEVLRSMGHTAAARDRFQLVLESDEPVPSDVLGRVHYALAEMYSASDDLLEAAAHFESAAGALRNSSSSPYGDRVFYPAIRSDVDRRRAAFDDFARAQHRVNHLDSLLHLGSLSSEEFDQFVQNLHQERLEADEEAARNANASTVGTSSWDSYEDEELLDEVAESDVSDAVPGSSGFLFHRDQTRVEEGQAAFVRRWGNRPLAPNWRRQSAASMRQAPAVASQRRLDPAIEESPAAPMPAAEELSESDEPSGVDVSDVPRDAVAREQMRDERTRAQFEAANALFLQLNRPDSAAVIYERILDENPDRTIAVRAHYALAETHRARGQMEEAESLFRALVEQYPDSEFAERALEFSGEEVATAIPTDIEVEAEVQFRDAMNHWERGDVAYGLGAMLVVAERFQNTDVAPRALYAAAYIFRDWADQEGVHSMPPLTAVLPATVLEAAGFNAESPPLAAQAEDALYQMDVIKDESGLAGPTLEDIYRRLIDRYPDSDQAEIAGRALALLNPAPDEQEGEALTPDADDTAHRTPEQAPETNDPLPGPGEVAFQRTIDWEAGAWTVVIVSWPQLDHARQSASTFRSRLADEEVDVDIFEDTDTYGELRYHVGVGQFGSAEEAGALLEELQSLLPDQSRVMQVPEQE